MSTAIERRPASQKAPPKPRLWHTYLCILLEGRPARPGIDRALCGHLCVGVATRPATEDASKCVVCADLGRMYR